MRARSENIRGCVANGADRDVGFCQQLSLLDRPLIHGISSFQSIAESMEMKIAKKPACFQFDCSDSFKISCGNTEECSALKQMIEDFVHRWKYYRTDFVAMISNIAAHGVACVGEARSPLGLRTPGPAQGVSQNPYICIAMRGDAVQAEITAGEQLQGFTESEVMDRILAVD
jgi:hypothetical protein